MKKTLTIFLLAAFGLTLKAQEANTDSTAVQTTTQQEETIDSLKQALHALEARVDKTEEENRDKKIWKNRSKFIHIGYITNQTLTGDMVKMNSEWGIQLTSGRTYYLHKKPILGMIKFGLDFALADISLVQYKDEYNLFPDEEAEEEDEEDDLLADLGSLQLEYGLRLGPSITINPVGDLKVSGYFHFNPSFSMLKMDEEYYYNYTSFFNAGGAIAYKAISVGVEWKWGKGKYDGFNTDFADMDFDGDDYEGDISLGDILDEYKLSDKFKTKSFRVYLSFRF